MGRAALTYSGVGRRIVLGLKHGDRTELQSPAGAWMALAGKDLFLPEMVVAPVPLHWLRLFRRRYNQSALLSTEVARSAGLTHCPDLLRRFRATPSQEGRRHDERFANLDRAIDVQPKRRDLISGKHVLLIDDVMASGATLAACANACLAAGAKEVRALVLARAVKDD